jgi:hypothetical protein
MEPRWINPCTLSYRVKLAGLPAPVAVQPQFNQAVDQRRKRNPLCSHIFGYMLMEVNGNGVVISLM